MTEDSLIVADKISGFKNKAVLRWRLKPGNWHLDDNILSNGEHSLTIETELPIRRIEVIEGLESRYYFQKKAVPVLEVEVEQSGEIITVYKYSKVNVKEV